MPFIGKQSTSNSQITNYTTTVGSGGQTNFTVVIEGGDETHVYLNGVLLKETTDYTVSSTQVSLVSAAVENDIVEIKVFRSFALVDAVRATGGTFSGDVTVPNLTLSSNVIKASDGGSTITLDTSDNVTIAGGLTTTGGITNAGTITAGTLGSSVVFPAGNVINLEVKQFANSGAHSLSTTPSYLPDNQVTYDVNEETSKIYVEFHPIFQTEHDGTVYSHKLSLRSSVDSYASDIGGGNVPQIIHYGTTSQVLWTQFPVIVSCFHDHNQTAGTTITYRMYGQTKTGTAGVYTWDAWSHTGGATATQHVVIYEVAQ